MRLERFVFFNGSIECLSGLHIGGSNEGIEIGGVDNPIIKHPITREPFVPGSSLKGKMRSSMEKKLGRVSNDGEPCRCGECIVCRVFGAHKNNSLVGPTRIIVRDAVLALETKQMAEQLLRDKGQVYIEQKTENVVDRVKGTALHPRTMERVPSGAKFDFEIVLQVYDIDKGKEEEMITTIKDGLMLVEQTYLGGYGSRGSGKVRFVDLTMDGKPFTLS